MPFDRLFGGDVPALLPELYLGLAAGFLLRWGGIVAVTPGGPLLRGPRNALALLVALVVTLLLAGCPSEGRALVSGTVVRDALSRGLGRLRAAAVAASLLARRRHLAQVSRNAFEYPLLRLLSLLGRLFLVGASDLITLYIALELQSLCLYVLAAFRRGSTYSTEAGLKYFVLGAFASGLLLFGASLLYGFLGTTAYGELGRLLAAGTGGRGPAPAVGALLVRVALLFKLAAGPFHRWSPDVLEGAPRSSSRFLAAVTKVAAVGALVRFALGPAFGLLGERLPRLVRVSATSRVIAALGALRQRRLKRFLAYSAIGHVGYLLVGLACGTLEGLQGLLLYRVLYVVGSVGAWTALRLLRGPAVGAPEASRPAVYIAELGGLGRAHPPLAAALSVCRFSRAGIPPRAGFYAKRGVFFAAREASLFGLALVGVLSSVVGAFYYLRWVKVRYFEGPPASGALAAGLLPVPAGSAFVLALAVVARVAYGLHPTPLLVATHQRALALCV